MYLKPSKPNRVTKYVASQNQTESRLAKDRSKNDQQKDGNRRNVLQENNFPALLHKRPSVSKLLDLFSDRCVGLNRS